MRQRRLLGAAAAVLVGAFSCAVTTAGGAQEARPAGNVLPARNLPAKGETTQPSPPKNQSAKSQATAATSAKSPSAKSPSAKSTGVMGRDAKGAAASGAASNTAVALAPHQVTGFRSARFGMAEPALRSAVAKDFRLKPDALRKAANPRDGTTTLIAEATDLLPGAGRSAIAYVQGHRSGSLIQVNVLWGAPMEPGRSARELAEIAEPLVAYFQRLRFAPLSVAVNVARADGRITLFQGRDQQGRMVSVDLRIPQAPGGRPDPAAAGAGLQVSYVADPDRPDVKPVAAR